MARVTRSFLKKSTQELFGDAIAETSPEVAGSDSCLIFKYSHARLAVALGRNFYVPHGRRRQDDVFQQRHRSPFHIPASRPITAVFA